MKAIRLTKHLQTGVWAIRLHRPERLNALSEQMAEELCSVLGEASKDRECRGVLIEGDEKAFSTGRDLKLSREHTPDQARRYLDLAVGSVIALLDCEVPTAVAVRGHCIGWGMEFALAADMRFADTTAKFRLPETSLGLFPGAGGIALLPLVVGETKAKELIYTARMVPGNEAHTIGLASPPSSDHSCRDAAIMFLEQTAANAPLAVRAAKRVLRSFWGSRDPRQLILSTRTERDALAITKDHREALDAFAERRKPVFRGE